MKNLLFLVGLIMVATACTSSGSSLFEDSSKEEAKESNVSFVIMEKHRNGTCDYGFCVSSYNEETRVLILDLNGEKFTYLLEDIKEEYYDQVKNNKVTLVRNWGEFIPVVVEKDETPYEKLPIFTDDYRKFKFRGILKDSNALVDGLYVLIYNGMFLNGLCNMGNQTYESGRFFYNEKDIAPEYDDSKVNKGYLSAGLSLYSSPHEFYRQDKNGDYMYTVVQSYCEDDYLVLKIEDGQIYKYPLNILVPQARKSALAGEPIGALQLSNKRWIPVYLIQGYGQYYGMAEVLYFCDNMVGLRDFNILENYSDFMLEVGITTSYQPVDYFFYKVNSR